MKKLKDVLRDKKIDKIMDATNILVGQDDKILPSDEPKFLGTNPVYLSAKKPIAAIQMFLPPGISRFFVERLDRNHVRFLISMTEVNNILEKADKLEKALKKDE